ncbi:acyl transferase 1-like [Lolium rigidum]|uniref:acyl transferase 1-like n=1 Tax=Lolium rigidum TaxID=89674 RepID=UPI001F5CBC85|nr:acyl transferase 1-like [Lolium rigidum]
MTTFTARRSKPELVVPARATPQEVKSLSDVDNQQDLRLYVTILEFFRRRVPGVPEQTAASSIIKAALAEALVYYYPVAGRLRELPGGDKLVVDCTAEGVVFVEAHADVRLVELGVPLEPPYPCVDQLLCDVGDVRAVVGKPLLYLQMTEFRCGGFAIALTMCHSIVDAFGKVQLLKCIIDLARGQEVPTILPSWERHLLVSSSEATSESYQVDNDATSPPAHAQLITLEGMVTRSFLFGSREIAALRGALPKRLARSATLFELITAVLWRCRTAALEYVPDERVFVAFVTNARGSWKRNPPLPAGFYGNALFGTVAEAAAGELCGGSLADAVELVREAKLRVTDEHVRSVLDIMARGKRELEVAMNRTFILSDITRCGDASLDLGWAERVGGGVPMAGDIITRLSSVYMSCKDANDEERIMVPMVLPEHAMGIFASQLAVATKELARSSL